jgi:hypothetical protein
MTGTLGFEGTWFDHATIAVHMALATSSLIFHVLPNRIMKRPLVIWHEYRLHAIVFTLRCCSAYAFAMFYPYQNNESDNLVQLCFLLGHHVVVDEITRRHGPGDERMTTVRGKTEGDDSTNAKTASKSVLKFYAYYQFCSLGSQLLPHKRLGDLGYNSLVAIQSSAFLMTLFRKGIIRWYTHAAWYTIALFMGMAVMIAELEPIYFLAKISFMFNLRVNFRMSKYPIWIFYAFISLPSVENFLF